VEHREQIEALVSDVIREQDARAHPGQDTLAHAWAEVQRQLRALRDTSTSLPEDERLALQYLLRL
jgi:hypothetical protein